MPPQVRVGRVRDEPGAEDGDRLLDALAELVEDPLALVGAGGAPLLQVARLGAAVALDREPGLVAGQVEEHEVGEQLAVEDRPQVELDVRRADQRRRVAQQPQGGAVAEQAPQPGVVGVQRLLHDRLRGAGLAVRGPVVQVDVPAERPERDVVRHVLAEAELAQQDADEPVPFLLVLPGLQQVRPGPGGLAADRLALLQAVGLRRCARHLWVAREHAVEQVGGEQAADDLPGRELAHAAPPGR